VTVARGFIVKRGEAYRIAVELPTDQTTGKRQRHWETFHGTKKEANKRLTELQGFVDRGRLGANSKMILTDFLDLWLEQHADTKADKTSLRYHQIVQHQLKPHLGSVRLDLLTPAVISGLDKKLRSENLAPQTRQHAHRVLHTALNYALTLRLIVSHPMDGLQAPSVPKKEMQVFDVAEARRFLETCRTAQLQRWADPDRLKWLAFFSVALNTGMRVSELRGLRWQDVDYEASELRVRQNALRIPKVGWVRKSTKTSGSVRSISIDATLLDMLKRHQAEVMNLRVLSPKFDEYDLVFPSEAGTPLEDRRIHYVFKHLCELAGVKKIRPYDLRHCCATLLLSAGVNPKVVQERLGHASVTLTLQTYSHVLPNIQKDAANTMGKLLG
jgi:integrase